MTKDFLFSQINVPAEFTNKVFFFFFFSDFLFPF